MPSMREANTTREFLNKKYDNWLEHPWAKEYFENSDFANFGYWDEDTQTQKEACENLMEKLLIAIPEKTGTILDVACGKGATTRHLTRHWPAEAVTGINISEKQLESCRKNAPGARFVLMSATDMDFEDASFDNIVCVEAAFHFITRKKFLQEAFRVLKPGGRIVMTDILSPHWVERFTPMLTPDNHIQDPEEYEEMLTGLGFWEVQVVDATDACWTRWNRQLVEFLQRKTSQGEMKPRQFRTFLLERFFRAATVRYYILVAARKPLQEAAGATAGSCNVRSSATRRSAPPAGGGGADR